jgi:hypothetical protein
MRKFGLKSVLLFSVLALSVFFYGCKQPTDPDKDPDKGGGGKKGGVEVPSGPLTADVLFGTLASLDDGILSERDFDTAGTAQQDITISVDNSDGRAGKKAYFTVIKTAAQSVSLVTGQDAASIELITEGGVEGSTTTAGDEITIVSVDLDNFDAQFEGKNYVFKLKVEEDEKAPITYTVNLNATPNFTGTAVFVVTRAVSTETDVKGGTLTRITQDNIADWTAHGVENVDEDGQSFTYISGLTPSHISFSEVSNLENALIWVNHNAMAETEYLIRV